MTTGSENTFLPFDYVRLTGGDYACVMRSSGNTSGGLAIPWYSSRQTSTITRAVKIEGQLARKLYRQKSRVDLDAFIHLHYPHALVADPLGGCVVDLAKTAVEHRFDGCKHFQASHAARRPIDLRPLLELLAAAPEMISSTGSWLLGIDTPADIDLVIHDNATGMRAARAIRLLIASRPEARVQGYWGRAHHHRRFQFGGWEICVRCSLPDALVEEYTRCAQFTGGVSGMACQVIDDSFGHCTPSMYFVKVERAGQKWEAGQMVPLISSESRHSFAFRSGERLYLDGIHAFVSSQGQPFLACHMGTVDGIRPV